MRRADAAHGGGAAVLLVIGMQDEQHVEGALDYRVRRVRLLAHPGRT
jgi:hypothetical protein